MKKKAFGTLIESLEQAVAYKNGDKTAARAATHDEAVVLLSKPCYETENMDFQTPLDVAIDVIKDLLHQFAYSGEKDGRAMLWTGGLSALESGFEFVGWDNPHFTPELECERTDCHAAAVCGASTPDGYRRLCSKHYQELPNN